MFLMGLKSGWVRDSCSPQQPKRGRTACPTQLLLLPVLNISLTLPTCVDSYKLLLYTCTFPYQEGELMSYDQVVSNITMA